MNVLITDNPLNVVGFDLVIDLRTDEKIESKNAISIFSVIEENADDIRKEVLAWLDSFNHLIPSNKNASEALTEFKNKNLWQINRLNERCNFGKLDQLDNIFKIIAISYYFKDKNHFHIFLNVKSRALNTEIIDNFTKQGINFQNLAKNYLGFLSLSCLWERGLFTNLFKSFPWLAIKLYEVFLNKYYSRLSNLKDIANSNFFFTYFSENDFKKELNYENSFWGNLPENFLLNDGSKVCWIYIYVGQKKNLKLYYNKLNTENLKSSNSFHLPIESFISPTKILKCYFKWIRMCFKGRKIIRDKNFKKHKYFNFIRKDLKESLLGIELLNNIIFEESMISLVKGLINPRKSFYLHENQSWEYFLRLYWHKTHKSSLSGFAHSYIRFWDLRYFYPKNFYFCIPNSPELLLCTSNDQLNAVKSTGFPKNGLKLVESLRYSWIERRYFKAESQFNILISGDYKLINNKKLFTLLPKDRVSDIKINYFFLPHPSSSISKILNILPNKITIINKDQISSFNFQLAIVSNLSAACIDYKILGIPTTYHFNESNLNMSPFRSVNACKSFNGEEDLKKLIIEISENEFMDKPLPNDFMELNKELTLWNKKIV
mgnify:CR=1 FL=1